MRFRFVKKKYPSHYHIIIIKFEKKRFYQNETLILCISPVVVGKFFHWQINWQMWQRETEISCWLQYYTEILSYLCVSYFCVPSCRVHMHFCLASGGFTQTPSWLYLWTSLGNFRLQGLFSL